MQPALSLLLGTGAAGVLLLLSRRNSRALVTIGCAAAAVALSSALHARHNGEQRGKAAEQRRGAATPPRPQSQSSPILHLPNDHLLLILDAITGNPAKVQLTLMLTCKDMQANLAASLRLLKEKAKCARAQEERVPCAAHFLRRRPRHDASPLAGSRYWPGSGSARARSANGRCCT